MEYSKRGLHSDKHVHHNVERRQFGANQLLSLAGKHAAKRLFFTHSCHGEQQSHGELSFTSYEFSSISEKEPGTTSP